MNNRIKGIEARLSAAVPGPWVKHDFGYPGQEEPSSIVVHAGKFDWQAISEGEFIASIPAWDSQEDANAEFIANAPADIAYLLAELRKDSK